jgi:hypothetical protein
MSNRFSLRTFAFGLLLASAVVSCDDDPAAPELTTVAVSLSAAAVEQGDTVTATASGSDQNDDPFVVGAVTWSTGDASIATVSAEGRVIGLAPGSTVIRATVGTSTGEATVTVAAPPALVINEVESNGGTPGDWVEIYNPGTTAVDIGGWAFKDNDDARTFRFPAGTVVAAQGYYVAEEALFGFGLGAADAARLFSRFGVSVAQHSWTAHAATSYGRCPNITGPFVTVSTVTKGAVNDCRPFIKINEVESNGGTPGDWIEIINLGTTTVDVSNFLVKDNDDARTTRLPAGTTIAPGAFFVIEEALMGFGLGGADAARIFDASGALIDSYEWTVHATITYGRCPDGLGAFAQTSAATKAAANTCGGGSGGGAAVWPGTDNVTGVGPTTSFFAGNLSGLAYEAGTPNVLWAVRNGPGTLYRLVEAAGVWGADPTGGFAAGKALRYTDGTGDVDAEGVTFAATSTVGGAATGGVYVAAERNNSANAVSRISVLRYDPSQAGPLTATNEWNLTADLPVVGANLGAEAITWIPDADLTALGFFDESKGRAYLPADYPNHGTGIFFVGLEGTGGIYAYALNHANNTFTKIATIATGFPAGVMGLEYDPATRYLWAVCDDTCGGLAGLLEVDVTPGSPTLGRFRAPRTFARPASMPNLNNEGFALTPAAQCVGGVRPVFWSDDTETGGQSLRRASMQCGVIAATALRAWW